MDPDVLILDEPAAGLDPRGRREIFRSIEQYQRKTGATVIIVSHSMEDMARLCDDIVVMAHAKVYMQGDREAIFSRADELVSIGLDIPQITQLMMILRQRGVSVPAGIYTVEEALGAIRALAQK